MDIVYWEATNHPVHSCAQGVPVGEFPLCLSMSFRCASLYLTPAPLKDKTAFQKQSYYSMSLRCSFISFFCIPLLFKFVLNLIHPMLAVNDPILLTISFLCSKPNSPPNTGGWQAGLVRQDIRRRNLFTSLIVFPPRNVQSSPLPSSSV